jgi:hypothetical protein
MRPNRRTAQQHQENALFHLFFLSKKSYLPHKDEFLRCKKAASLQPIKVNSARKLAGIEQHGFISTLGLIKAGSEKFIPSFGMAKMILEKPSPPESSLRDGNG